MTNQKLIQDGYKPIDLVVLHDAGVVMRPTNASNTEPWWTEYPSTGKTFTVNGRELADLAEMMGVNTQPLKCTGKSGKVSYHGLSFMTIPLVSVELEDHQNSGYQIKSLWGKVENGVLHLAALFENEEPAFSIHGGSFDISWDCSLEKVLHEQVATEPPGADVLSKYLVSPETHPGTERPPQITDQKEVA